MKKIYLLIASVVMTVLLLVVTIFLFVDSKKYKTSHKEIANLASDIQNDLKDVGTALNSSTSNEVTQIRTIKQDNVELKSKPDKNSETLKKFISGENVFPTNVISYNESEYWIQVADRNGEKGWLLEENLK